MTDQTYDYDLVTIGAGSGGVRASRVAAGTFGAKVAIVEMPFGFVSSDTVGGAGGTCVIRGCVPKKLMMYASEFREAFEDARGFGWESGIPPYNLKEFMERKATEIQRLNSVYMNILSKSGVEFFEGRGMLLDAHTVEVRGADGSIKRLTARNILIATGGYAVKLNIPGSEYAITSDEALVIDELPGPDDRIVIIGAGYIGLEFACIFNGLGAKVEVLYRGEAPLVGFDNECRRVVAENLKSRGIIFHTNCSPTSIEREANGKYKVNFTCAKQECDGSVTASKVMFATGRKPATKGLGLEDIGVEMNERSGGIKVDDYSQTNIPSIWAIGDVTERKQLTPVALMEGKALAATLFGGRPTKPNYEYIATAIFAQPPLASVGMSEEEAIQQLKGDIDVYVSKFRPMKNTLSGRDERTFMKLIVHCPTDKVVGCQMVGPDAPEIMQGLAVALKCGATKAQFDSTVGIHPSAAEEFVTMSTPTRRVQGEGQG